MKKPRSHRLALWTAALATLGALALAASSGGDFVLRGFSLDGGGGGSAGGAYVLNGVAGQPDAGRLAGGDFTLRGGIGFPAGALQPTPTPGPTPTPTATPTATPTPGPTPTPDVAAIRDMITHFYHEILARAPEAGAVDAWQSGYFEYAVGFDIDVRFVPREMGRQFFLSAEYAGRARTDAEFVADCYRAFLYREPTAQEAADWSSGTWDRGQVMTLFAESDEFAGRVQSLFPHLEGDPTRNFVTTMYVGLLDRLVDAGGLAYWADEMDAASDKTAQAKTMGRQITASQEYLNRTPTARDHVERLYRAYLGRFPAQSETDYWTGEIDAGRESVESLIGRFADSPEFQARLDQYFGASASALSTS